MRLVFRRMRQADVPRIYELEKRIFPDPWSAESFSAEVQNKALSYPCVMESEQGIVGYAVCWYFSGELHISNFAVNPQQRRQGLGRRLLHHLFEHFADYQVALLEVRASNRAAIALYKRFGFRKLYVREKYYSDGEDALVMIKER